MGKGSSNNWQGAYGRRCQDDQQGREEEGLIKISMKIIGRSGASESDGDDRRSLEVSVPLYRPHFFAPHITLLSRVEIQIENVDL